MAFNLFRETFSRVVESRLETKQVTRRKNWGDIMQKRNNFYILTYIKGKLSSSEQAPEISNIVRQPFKYIHGKSKLHTSA